MCNYRDAIIYNIMYKIFVEACAPRINKHMYKRLFPYETKNMSVDGLLTIQRKKQHSKRTNPGLLLVDNNRVAQTLDYNIMELFKSFYDETEMAVVQGCRSDYGYFLLKFGEWLSLFWGG